MSDLGRELKEYNDKIVGCIVDLKDQRDELTLLIQKQQDEKVRLQTEIERISYKLTLITKSLQQRISARTNYDRTIEEAEESYKKIVESSGVLLSSVQKEVGDLEQIMDKRVGTSMLGSDLRLPKAVGSKKSVASEATNAVEAAEPNLELLDE